MHISLIANKLGALIVALSDAVVLASHGSASSDAALLTLMHWGPTRVTALAKVLGLSQPATTRLAAKLRDDGLVVSSLASGRERPFKLTAKGMAEAHAVQARRLDALGHALSPLAKTDLEALDRILSLILTNVVAGPAHARHICRFCDHGTCVGPLCPVGSAARAMATKGENHDPGA